MPSGQGQVNIAVLLNRSLDLTGLDDWQIWWAANLGTAHEVLVAGRVADVHAEIEEARARTKATAGWVMDIHLVRRGAR